MVSSPITPTREGYRKPDGTLITLNAQQVIAKLHPHPPTYRRSPIIRVGIAKAATTPGWQPTAPTYSPDESAIIRAAMAHTFWQRLEVLQAPAHCIDHQDRAACSIDLLARSREKGEPIVAAVHTAPYEHLNPEALAAELGAAIIMLSDDRRMIIHHAMVLCATPGNPSLHSIPVDVCTIAWVEGLSDYFWLQRALSRSATALPTGS